MGPRPREEQEAGGPLGASRSLPAPGHAITVDGSFPGGCIRLSLTVISWADGLFLCSVNPPLGSLFAFSSPL